MGFGLAVMIGSAVMVPFAKSSGEKLGYERGLAAGRAECQQETIDELTVLITSSQYLVRQAHTASQHLAKTISDRQQADATSTRELRHALALTAAERAQCRFDAVSLRHVESARDRAAAAAAGGIGSAMPAASGDD